MRCNPVKLREKPMDCFQQKGDGIKQDQICKEIRHIPDLIAPDFYNIK